VLTRRFKSGTTGDGQWQVAVVDLAKGKVGEAVSVSTKDLPKEAVLVGDVVGAVGSDNTIRFWKVK
jgi:hypothetical protein